MAGIYLHIPFCKQACHYCNFHFSTSLRYKEEMIAAMVQEIHHRHTYLDQQQLQSIYFGGGTPSLLDQQDLERIFATLAEYYTWDASCEITLEANPDDITPARLAVWQALPLNRLSIGIQSFSDTDLQLMNRAHNAAHAEACIGLAQDHGFDNLTVDLIYGAPSTTDAIWADNVQRLLKAGIPHISCYALTVEPQTALAHQISKGKVVAPDEEQAARQFEQLVSWLEADGFIHYEISNFAKPDHFAVHNSNYWKGIPYLGVGPSAHSFDGESRQWNVANNAKYMQALAEGPVSDYYEREVLSLEDQYNEYIMTGLRTIWGIDLGRINPAFREYFNSKVAKFVSNKVILKNNNKFILSKSARFLADGIASDLFV